MAQELRPLDISDLPDLRALVDELRRSREPRVLRVDSEDVAILTPVTAASQRRPRARTKTAADYDAFHASAGSWDGIVDVEQFKRDNAASRQIATRPSVEL